MTTRLLCSWAFIALFVTNSLTAGNSETTSSLGSSRLSFSTFNHQKSVLITVSNTMKQDIFISIEDSNGNILHEDLVKTENRAIKKYVLSPLDKGEYRFIIKKNHFKTIQPVKVTADGVDLLASERTEKTLPYVVLKNHNMDVSVLLPDYGDIKVRLYDIEGKKVREDVFTNVFQLHKRYDLSKLISGIYFAEISVGEETETFTLKL